MLSHLSTLLIMVGLGIAYTAPDPPSTLSVVTVDQFGAFVEATGYQTDAERYGWSVVQQDVFRYQVVKGATWQLPDGLHAPASPQLPVTQVSYQDAQAYCQWSGTRLPSYSEYWVLTADDRRPVVTNYSGQFSEVEQVNIRGNVWEITGTTIGATVRLAGGSRYCSPTTCHGTSQDRELYVDLETGNSHIGFAVVGP